MVIKITNNNWINRGNICRISSSIGGLHVSNKITMDFNFYSNGGDVVSVSTDLIPHTLIIDRVGTDYEKIDAKLATDLLTKCDVNWVPSILLNYVSMLGDNGEGGMNLPSFKNWVDDMLVTSSEEHECGVKEYVDSTTEIYLNLLENLVKEKIWKQ